MSNATGLLKRALEELEIHGEVSTWDLIKDIRTFLAAEPEADPVAWMWLALEDGEVITQYGPYLPNLFRKTGTPLYTRPEPAIRKPMTSEEMEKQYEIDKEYFGESVMRAFYNGIRFAEKHHFGIGGDDNG